MATIKVKAVVSNLSNVMLVFDRIKVYRSTTGAGGPFVEITTPSTRMALVAGTIVYEYIDTAGDPTYWYRTSYFNSITSNESRPSDAQQGEGDSALTLVSVDELKTNYLFGLDLTDDQGNEYPDSLYEWFIRSAISWLEHRLDIPIAPKTLVDEKHDYFAEDYGHYIWMKLEESPVINVEEVRMVLPGEQVVQTFDSTWIQLQKHSGQLQLAPGTGAAGSILLGAAGAYIAMIYRNNRFIPNAFRVDYTAGFEPGQVPPVILDLIGKKASFGPLNIAGDLLGGAGIASQSIGIDGLSQSFNTTSSATNAGYGARLIQYTREIKEVLPMLEKYYKGIRMVIV
jgi:hypothetical protein